MTTVAVQRPMWRDAPPPPGQTVAQGEFGIDPATYFPNSYWAKPIEDYTPYNDSRDPAATSRNWVINWCQQCGIDPVNGGNAATPVKLWSGATAKGWMGTSNPLYVVPRDQPIRTDVFHPPQDYDPSRWSTIGAPQFRDVIAEGIPLPIDAMVTANYNLVGTPTSGTVDLRVTDYNRQLEMIVPDVQWNETPASLTAKLSKVFAANGYDPAFPVAKGVNLNTAAGLQVDLTPGPFVVSIARQAMTPALAVKGVGDRWCNVYQPSTGKAWELFRVTRQGTYGEERNPDGMMPLNSVGWGGVVQGHVHQHIGTYRNRYNVYDEQIEHQQWGSDAISAVNLPFVDYHVYEQCIRDGTAYPFAVPASTGNAQKYPIPWLWPGTRADGTIGSATAPHPEFIPEGARLAFPHTSQVDDWIGTKVRPWMRPLAKAIQNHGCILRDKNAQAPSLQWRAYSMVGGSLDYKTLIQLADPNDTRSWDANYDMNSLPWHLAVVVHPDQSK